MIGGLTVENNVIPFPHSTFANIFNVNFIQVSMIIHILLHYNYVILGTVNCRKQICKQLAEVA